MPTVEQTLNEARDFLANGNVSQNGTEPDFIPPPFPMHILPEPLRGFVEKAAKTYPVPNEMVAMPIIVAIGSLIGNRAVFAIKNSHHQYPCLWLAIIAESGDMKTPPLSVARRGIVRLQQEENLRYQSHLDTYEREMVRRKQEKGYHGDDPEKPVQRHYYTTDITMEAVASRLISTPGMLYSADELVVWVERLNQYRQGGDRQQYMSIWSTEPLKVDRKSEKGSLDVDRPVMSVCGTVQLDVVIDMHGAKKRLDGFVYRMLPIFPHVETKIWNENDFSDEDQEGLFQLYSAIDSNALGETKRITMTPAAKRMWIAWANDHNIITDTFHGPVRGFYRKLEATCARFALILHVARHPTLDKREISRETLGNAIDLLEWIKPQVHEFIRRLEIGDTNATDSKPAGLWDRIERAIRRLSGCPSCQMSEPHELSDNCWVTARKIQRSLTITIEQLLNELDTQLILCETRHLTVSGRDQVQVRLTINNDVRACSTDLTSDSPDDSDIVVADPPPF